MNEALQGQMSQWYPGKKLETLAKASSSSVSLSDGHLTLKHEIVSTIQFTVYTYICNYIM